MRSLKTDYILLQVNAVTNVFFVGLKGWTLNTSVFLHTGSLKDKFDCTYSSDKILQ